MVFALATTNLMDISKSRDRWEWEKALPNRGGAPLRHGWWMDLEIQKTGLVESADDNNKRIWAPIVGFMLFDGQEICLRHVRTQHDVRSRII